MTSTIEVLPLGEVVKPTRPRVKPADYPKLPFIGMEHIEAHSMKLLGTVPAGAMKSSAVYFKPGDVLYGRLRPYLNKVYHPSFEGLCSAEFIVLPENERVDGAYLQYVLNSSAFVRYASHLNTGDRPRVDFDQLAPYKIPLPPKSEQRCIVAEIESSSPASTKPSLTSCASRPTSSATRPPYSKPPSKRRHRSRTRPPRRPQLRNWRSTSATHPRNPAQTVER